MRMICLPPLPCSGRLRGGISIRNARMPGGGWLEMEFAKGKNRDFDISIFTCIISMFCNSSASQRNRKILTSKEQIRYMYANKWKEEELNDRYGGLSCSQILSQTQHYQACISLAKSLRDLASAVPRPGSLSIAALFSTLVGVV